MGAMRRGGRRRRADNIAYMLVLLAMVYLMLHFIGQRTSVKGISMEPALSEGDQILVDKLSYYFKDPERFDIVIFREGSLFYIKRIIALPGERIWISRSGDIFVDDRILDEGYGKEDICYAGLAGRELLLGEQEYFVLGDNRNESLDSRYEEVGMVKRSQIVGRAVFRIYPFGESGFLAPSQ